MKLFSSGYGLIKDSIFIIRNVLCSIKMPEFQRIEFDKLTIEPCRKEYLEEIFRELRLTLSSIKDLHFRSVTAEPLPS